MKNISYLPHKISLFALFMLGEAVILLPFKSSTDKTLIAFLIAAFIGIPLLVLVQFLLKKAEEIKTLKNTVKIIIYILFIIYSLYLAANTFNVFMDFVYTYVLIGVSKLFSAMVFFSVTLTLSFLKRNVLYKFGIVTAAVSLVLIIILFAFSVGQFSLDNISLLSMPSLKDVYSESLTYLKSLILPSLILLIFEDDYNKKGNLSVVVRGYSFGLCLHLICLLNSLLIFGTSLSARLDFAYSEAIATVTAGNIFTRMDGFSYFVFFISCLVKITLCLKISGDLVKKIMRDKLANCRDNSKIS